MSPLLRFVLAVQAVPMMPADSSVSMLPVDTAVRALTMRSAGGAAEKALAVLPAAAEGAFELPSAARGDLQRSGAVAALLGAPLQERNCYSTAEFQRQWAKHVAV